MSATHTTTHYNLPLFEATDKPTWLGDWNSAMTALDSAIYEASQTGSGESGKAEEALEKANQAIQQATEAQSQAATALSTATAAQTAVTNLTTDVTENATEIESLKTTVATMQTTLQTATANITTLQQSVTAVDTKATTASTNAQTALTKATNAETQAASALSTANTAKTTAESAQSTANAAQSTANTNQIALSKITPNFDVYKTNPNVYMFPFIVDYVNDFMTSFSATGTFYEFTGNYYLTISYVGKGRGVNDVSSGSTILNLYSKFNPYTKYVTLEPLNLTQLYYNGYAIGRDALDAALSNITSMNSNSNLSIMLSANSLIPKRTNYIFVGSLTYKFSGNEWQVFG